MRPHHQHGRSVVEPPPPVLSFKDSKGGCKTAWQERHDLHGHRAEDRQRLHSDDEAWG